MRLCTPLLTAASVLVPTTALAQVWNDSVTTAIVRQAIARRALDRADSTLHDYRARAHGFVFFLGQFGEGFEEPPRLVKSDELVLEVYWKAPGRSKQRIVGWRDRVDLPTGIQYHRDHLGIVLNNFDDRIGLGHDDEVRNVPHPLARDGPQRYDYRLIDSLSVRLPGRVVRVYEVLTRPQDPGTPAVVGSLFLDASTAELVRFRLNFTKAAYVDKSLEDITIVLENGLWDERYWLPRRQEIEIRRRSTWLDIPARGIIRGRWIIEDYEFNVGLDDTLFRGFEIVAADPAIRDRFEWDRPLDVAIRDAAGTGQVLEFDEVRANVRELMATRLVSGLPFARPGARSISDLLHFNRVEGLTPGGGWVFRPGGGAYVVRVWGSYGFADHRVKGRLSVAHHLGSWLLNVEAARDVADIGDEPVIAPLLNSLAAQEIGRDYGDYVLTHRVRATMRRRFATDVVFSMTVGTEHSASVKVDATPLTGNFRQNAALGSGTRRVSSVALAFDPPRAAGGLTGGGVVAEVGNGSAGSYLRVRGRAELTVPMGSTQMVASGVIGLGTDDLPPDRSFVLGGRGTLISEPFRAYGGRSMAMGRLEWRFGVPFPALPLGGFATTGNAVTVSPFVSAGWAGREFPDLPWRASNGVRVVTGLTVEWFHRLLRVEVGASLRDRRSGIAIDLRRDLWPIL